MQFALKCCSSASPAEQSVRGHASRSNSNSNSSHGHVLLIVPSCSAQAAPAHRPPAQLLPELPHE